LSRFVDLARDVASNQAVSASYGRSDRPYRVVTITSNKGGVGKTTIASNLAVYLRELRRDLPVLLIGFDDQATIDRMFAGGRALGGKSVSYALQAGTFDGSIQRGRYGVHYVPSSRDVWKAKRSIRSAYELRDILERTAWEGLILLDTKADLEILTQNAIAASDLSIVVVKDQASLEQAERVFEMLPDIPLPREQVRVLLSLVNLRVKFAEEGRPDLLSLLISKIREQEYGLFESFISLSPKVESLHTNPEGTALPISHGAPDSLVHTQFMQVAHEVLDLLGPKLPALKLLEAVD
jgi:cellulose biosynthesis protein BcsQ